MSQRAEGRRVAASPAGAPAAAAVPPWTHEGANQRIVLAGVAVAYQLQRSRRRTIGFSVDTSGLAVRAPRRSRQADIDAALHGKQAWILSKLAAADERRRQLQARRTRWQHDTRLPYLGGELLLQVQVQVAESTVRAQARLLPLPTEATAGPSLQLRVPPTADARLLADLTERWMRAQARQRFRSRLQHFAPLLGVCWQRLRLSSARTRWGSASTRGTISLHWRLMQLPPEVIDYVVVHELAHLLEMNHGARFWGHVARILPDYAERRAALKAADLPPWI